MRSRYAALAMIGVALSVTRPSLGGDEPTPRRPFVAPPLTSIVEASLLVRAHGDFQVEIAGAHRAAILSDGVERWDFDRTMTPSETLVARVALAADPRLDVALDLYRQAELVPDDEGYKNQWPLQLMHADQAWDLTTGDDLLVVAVVDTGVVNHPDLKPRLVAGYDFISDADNGGDGDGRDPDPTDTGTEAESSSGFHGSHISGIIGAASGNGIGMAGVDWHCRLQPVRVLGVNRHRGKDSDIADGIRWAAGLNVPGVPQNTTPAKVINLSFGGPGYSQILQDAVLAAQARGSIVVASAGNNHEDAIVNVPGALEGVMSIAAAAPDGSVADYSNFGARVDLMAPGGSFFIDAPVGNDTPGAVWSTSFVRASSQPVFAYAAGTSQAAAHASGVAALVRAAAPTMRPEVVAAVMRRAARIPASGCEQGCGTGLIDANLAVTYARQFAVATCGSIGCGNARFQPAPLRPEEGCAIARVTPARHDDGAAAALAVFTIFATMSVMRRRTKQGR